MSNFAITVVVAFVILAIFWVSLHYFWKWIPRRPSRDSAGGGDVASALAALIQETRQALETGSIDDATVVSMARRLRELHARRLETAASNDAENLVAEIRANATLAGLLHGVSPSHLRLLDKIIATVIADPDVSESEKQTLRVVRAGLPSLTS
jgi:hypothetical protein